MNLQASNYVQLHLRIHKIPMDSIAVDLIGSFEMTIEGNQYVFMIICRLTYHLLCVPIPNKQLL